MKLSHEANQSARDIVKLIETLYDINIKINHVNTIIGYIQIAMNKATNDSKPELDNHKTADIICELMIRYKDSQKALDLLNSLCKIRFA